MREELHRLLDQLPEDEVQPALQLIRSLVAQHEGRERDLPFFASFEAGPDLAERAGLYEDYLTERREEPGS